jgi:hypothetical protein
MHVGEKTNLKKIIHRKWVFRKLIPANVLTSYLYNGVVWRLMGWVWWSDLPTLPYIHRHRAVSIFLFYYTFMHCLITSLK